MPPHVFSLRECEFHRCSPALVGPSTCFPGPIRVCVTPFPALGTSPKAECLACVDCLACVSRAVRGGRAGSPDAYGPRRVHAFVDRSQGERPASGAQRTLVQDAESVAM